MNSAYLISGVILAVVAVLGVIIACAKGAIRFAQYMVRSEEAQTRTADSVEDIQKTLDSFMVRTDERLNLHESRLAVVEWEVGVNGRTSRQQPH